MPTHLNEKIWRQLTLEDKVEELRKDIITLFSIAEEFRNQHHVFSDAFQVVHEKLNSLTFRKSREPTQFITELVD